MPSSKLLRKRSNNPTQTTLERPARPYNILLFTVKMSSSVSTTTHGVVVITHVHPAGNGLGMGASPPTCMGRVGPVVSSVMERFREGHPKALGTVQIVFGAMAFLFGIVMTVGEFSLGVLSGIFVWGSIIYIIAGSLTIAAEKSLNKCLVKASLGMNVVATVTACIGTVLYSLDAAGVTLLYHCYDYNYNNYGLLCQQYRAKHQGISGVMALFSLLEMMVTISVSAFACKAVCHSPLKCSSLAITYLKATQGHPVPSQTTLGSHRTAMRWEEQRAFEDPKRTRRGIASLQQQLTPPQYSIAIIPRKC
ncbi:membrane-spanning 4-domains subfamily A member 4A-like isoform X2 [Hypomesus transpacificus]|uniref:membrane-spanning 4-domains subfamily A member 4A-like isoform X2 n=1 Tax=Hypomesus transpacificus TaxID=137520 RepID=UPI001F077ABB|nr:membrane-spanning 4-domains subfamily A member 4A-like isoform X2 [Hypomesus transpacificus]